MDLYHVNKETGEAGKCSATKGKCPFGGSADHFTSPEAARHAYEQSQSTFESKPKFDLSTLAPHWEAQLPEPVQRKIEKRVNEISAREGELRELGPSDPLDYLTPRTGAIRERGVWLVNTSELDDYQGSEDFLIAIHSRQGGGNRECYCDDYDDHEDGCLAVNNDELESHPQFEFYEDDEFDSTYTTHYFRSGLTAYDVAQLERRKLLNNEISNELELRKLVNGGHLPPWAILGDGKAYQEYVRAKSNYSYTSKAAKEAQDTLAKVKPAIDSIRNMQPLTDEQKQELEPLVRRGYDKGSGFFNSYRDLLEKNETLRAAQARHDQAEKLPPGELRDYLIGDRGTGTYEATEMRGRRKVQVKKSYQRGTLLGKELEYAKGQAAYSQKQFKEKLKELNEKSKELKEKAERGLRDQEELEKKRKKAWSSGWPGLMRDVPEIKESF